MRAINHAVTGALIGTAVGQPLLALPLAYASHFVLDGIPHWESDEKDLSNRMMRSVFLGALVVDALSCFALFCWLIYSGAVLPAFCAVAAASPDFMWLPMFVKSLRDQKPELPRGPLARLHIKVQ